MARGLGRPCIAGCSSIHIDEVRGVVIARGEGGGIELEPGERITIDGSTGFVYRGVVEMIDEPDSPDLGTVFGWANAMRRLRVHAIADSTTRALAALRAGADGIGLLACDSLLADESARFAARCVLLADPESDESAEHEASLEAAFTAFGISCLTSSSNSRERVASARAASIRTRTTAQTAPPPRASPTNSASRNSIEPFTVAREPDGKVMRLALT